MGSKTSTVTEKADPWGPSQPYLLDAMKQSQKLYRGGKGMVAPENPYLMKGYQNMLQQAKFNPQNSKLASGVMQDTMRGDYMDGNPYLDKMYGRAAEGVSDGVTSMFSGAGRYGSGAHQEVMGDSLAGLASDMYGNAYQTERQNMLNAAQFAPSLDQSMQGMMFNNANAMLGVGQGMQDHDQMRYMAPYNELNHYSNAVNGMAGLGGTGSQTTPNGSRLGGAVGGGIAGAAAGAGMGSFLGIPGAIIGGGLGAIGGLF